MRYQIGVFLFVLSTVGAFAKNNRIIGGEITNTNAEPFIATLRYLHSNQIFCIGAIISNKHILTAAHCLFNEPRTFRRVRVNTGLNHTVTDNAVMHEIAKVFFHPEYDPLKSKAVFKPFDVAIIKLKLVFPLNEFQNVIELPNKAIDNDVNGYIVGWASSLQITDVASETLRKYDVIVYLKEVCSNIYRIRMRPGQFCIRKYLDVGPTVGDGGGPLVIDGKVVGVASILFPFFKSQPLIYTDIYYHLNFIIEILDM